MPHSDHGHARKQRFQERLHVLHDTALHRKLKSLGVSPARGSEEEEAA